MKDSRLLQIICIGITTLTIASCGNSPESLFVRKVPVGDTSEDTPTPSEGDKNNSQEEQPNEDNPAADPGSDNSNSDTNSDGGTVSNPPTEEESEEADVISLREKILQQADIPERALDNAFAFFDENIDIIKNRRYLTIINFFSHSNLPRMFIIDLNSGNVDSLLVAHGKNSDTNHDGYATDFSNVSGSKQSSLGFMLTAERYYGSHGISMRLDGLESRNSKARPRAIVVHGATYVDPNRSLTGRSWGCPAVEMSEIQGVIERIENGSLMYSYYNE